VKKFRILDFAFSIKEAANKKILFITLSAMLFALCSAAQAQQQPRNTPTIGYLSRDTGPDSIDEAFMEGLRALGWIESQNIVIEYRRAAYKMDRLRGLAEDLVRLKVDLIVTATQQVTMAAKQATGTIPIVMRYSSDAVDAGLIASLARPGGNVTGLSEQYPDVNTKLLEVLHETLPNVKEVAFLWDPDSSVYTKTYRAAQAVAPALRLSLQSLELRHKNITSKKMTEDIESRLRAVSRERAGALVIVSRLYGQFGRRIAEFSAKNRVPVFSVSTSAVEKYSGLLAYAPDWSDMSRRAATYVDKILKGRKPADLPVEQPRKFKLVISLKTAEQIGLTIPPNVLARADRVIR
jgi:putative ABC transport system substrate-binding protein